MKNRILLLFIFIASISFAQKKKSTKLGLTTLKELQMPVYAKDSSANAVVLYEHANLFIDNLNDFNFRTDHYYRIKLFKKEGYDKATINIPLYKKERVDKIEAITYTLTDNNIIKKEFLKKSQIFTNQRNKNWKEVSFTMPNLKEGCVIEIVYTVFSPYSQLDDWYFQSDIPKIKSDYTSAILGNYKYNARLIGFLKLDRDKPSVKKNCVNIPGIGNGSCLVLSYGMDSIPAFKEEDYMLSKRNFISRIVFDQISYTNVKGWVKKYTKTWKDADKTFRKRYLNSQTSKVGFYKKKLPQKLFNITDDLEKATKVYGYIQNRFTWNERYWTRGKLKIKNNFDEKNGSVDAINLSLYNSLQALKIESYIVMVSTRSNGVPTKLYPVTKDFNYILVKAVINDKTYFLDATNKFLSFGDVPLRCLNGEGRVLDFKKGSYWEMIKPKTFSSQKIKAQFKISDNGFQGKASIISKGYFAVKKRASLENVTEDEYLENFESSHSDFEVESYVNKNKEEFNKPLIEEFKMHIEEDFVDAKTVRINPFFFFKTAKNPFKLKNREYPVDFGYSRKKTYFLTLVVPENYAVKKIPKNKALKLPNKGGVFIFKAVKNANFITIYYKFLINKKIFSNKEYFSLKEFYKQLIEKQKEYIELEKK